MKKFIKYFVLVLTICSIFTLNAFALTNQDGVGSDTLTCGIPFDLYYDLRSKSTGEDGGQLVISNANVFLTNSDNNGSAFTGSAGTTNINFNINSTINPNVADITIGLSNPSYNLQLNGWKINVPIAIAEPFDYSDFVGYVSMYWQEDIGILRGSVPVTYVYNVVTSYPYGEADNTPQMLTYSFDVDVPLSDTTNENYHTYGLYLNTIRTSHIDSITRALKDSGRVVVGSVIQSISVYVDYGHQTSIPANYANTIYVSDAKGYATRYSTISNKLGTSFYDQIRSRYVQIRFDNLDWTSWLTSSVGSFMNFQIVPGLPIYGIFSILVGIPLLLWFLKLFAGG